MNWRWTKYYPRSNVFSNPINNLPLMKRFKWTLHTFIHRTARVTDDDVSKMLQTKGSVIQIKKTDELCCARAVVTAIAQVEQHPQWNSIRQGCAIQRQPKTYIFVHACLYNGVELKKLKSFKPYFQSTRYMCYQKIFSMALYTTV